MSVDITKILHISFFDLIAIFFTIYPIHYPSKLKQSDIIKFIEILEILIMKYK